MKRPVLLKQQNMLRVLYALAPLALLAIYYFGWRSAAVISTALAACFVTEWIMASSRNGKVSYACFVTASIYALTLPPTTPFWIVAVGGIIAILFAKEAFGGFGKNIFNPAIVGRAFVYVCFPLELTAGFVPVFEGWPGGFAQWSLLQSAPPAWLIQSGLSLSDAVTAATPLLVHRDFGHDTGLLSLFLGSIGGIFEGQDFSKVLAAGSMGEGCVPLIILSGIYLLATKTANWRLMVSLLIGAAVAGAGVRIGMGSQAASVPVVLASGGLMFAAVFMITDPISAPKLPLSQWIYGAFTGALIVFFRQFGVFVEGVGFALLLGNTIAPSLDLWIKRWTSKPAAGAPAA